MPRGSISKSPASQIITKDYVSKGIPKHMGGSRSGDSNDPKMDHSISQQSEDRTKVR